MLHALIALSAAQDLSFAVVGDTQTAGGSSASINPEVFPGIVEGANALGADYLLVAGDLVGGTGSVSGTVDQWADFQAVAADFEGTVLVVPGNHDMYGGSGSFEAFRQTFGMPEDDHPPGEAGVSWVLDDGNTRFIGVTSDQESGGYSVSNAALSWLDETLADSGAFEHVFVMTHHPVTFSQEGSLGGTGGDLWQLMVGYGVEALFTGHWHRIQLSQPGAGGSTWEGIVGTGGGWQGYEPVRPYQQVHGFLYIEVEGAEAVSHFVADEDGDGLYDEILDSQQLSWEGAQPTGLRLGLDFSSGEVAHVAEEALYKPLDHDLIGDARLSEGALVLDGEGDALELGGIGDYVLAFKGDMTARARVRVDSLKSGTWANTLFCYATNDYYSEDEETNYSYWLSVQPTGELVAFWEYGDGQNVTLTSTEASSLGDGQWHEVAMVREGMELRFVVDGEQLGEALSFTRPPTGGGRGLLTIGSDTRAYLGGESDLHGAIEALCLFDEALSDEEIAALEGDCLPKEPEDTSPPDSPSHSDPLPDSDPDSEPGDEPPIIEPEPTCGCGGGSAAGLILLGLVALGRRTAPNQRSPGAERRKPRRRSEAESTN